MATTTHKITRSVALQILKGLDGAGNIFGVTFVTRGDDQHGPQLRTMSCAKGVTRHLRGGEQPYTPADHGLMTVYEMLSPAAALADYRASATAEIHAIDERISKKRAALAEARTKLSAKNTKANRTSVDNKVKALEEFTAKRKHEELKLGPCYIMALRAEIEARIARKESEVKTLELDSESDEGYCRHQEGLAALKREQESLIDPEETLRIRYRNINLSGITRLKVNGVEYKITTPPSPAAP